MQYEVFGSHTGSVTPKINGKAHENRRPTSVFRHGSSRPLLLLRGAISLFSGSAALYLVAKWISGFILEECSLWLEIRACVRACVRAYVYPPLANFYFCLVLKPFSVHKGTMGAIAELQVDAFSTNTGNVFQSHRYVRATGTIQVFVTCYIPE